MAEIRTEPVGLAWARLESGEPGVVHLYQMWVDPVARRTGIGRSLLEAAIGWAVSLNARCVRLSVTCGNTPAARLYARCGFAPIGAPEPLRPGSALRVQPLELQLAAA